MARKDTIGALPQIAKLLRVTRPLNLGIIAAAQLSVAFFVLQMPIADYAGILAALVVSTLSTAASGYVFNDICDQDTDRHNKPARCVVGVQISEQAAYRFYYALCAVALLTALALPAKLLVLHIFSLAALYVYARWLKCSILWGNVLVAALSAVSLAEPYWLFVGQDKKIAVLIFFAFGISLLREVIKDAEDIHGDRLSGCATFPVRYGEKTTQRLFLGLTCAYSIGLVLSSRVGEIELPFRLYTWLLAAGLPAATYYHFFVAQLRAYSRWSTACKVCMGIGLVLLPWL